MSAAAASVDHTGTRRAPTLGALRVYLYHRVEEVAASGLVVGTLDAYALELAAACAGAFAGSGADEWLETVVAVRPGHRARAWLLSPRPADDPRVARARDEVEAIPAPLVSRLVVLAVSGTVGCAAPRWRARRDGAFPWPDAWGVPAWPAAGTFERVVRAAWPEAASTGVAPYSSSFSSWSTRMVLFRGVARSPGPRARFPCGMKTT